MSPDIIESTAAAEPAMTIVILYADVAVAVGYPVFLLFLRDRGQLLDEPTPRM